MSVKFISSWASSVLRNYQNFIEITANMIYLVALGLGLKCLRKVHLNTQWGKGTKICQNWYGIVVKNKMS